LKRVRNTYSQSLLKKEDRLVNVKDAFRITDRSKVEGKAIFLWMTFDYRNDTERVQQGVERGRGEKDCGRCHCVGKKVNWALLSYINKLPKYIMRMLICFLSMGILLV